MDSNTSIPVPCGKCPECIARRVSGWSFRLMQEEKNSTSAYFLTLTYDTQHTTLSRNGFMTLVKRDVQLFFKRLRFDVSKIDKSVSIKYYLAGEYGGKTKRPHYHAIVFNVPHTKHIEAAWQLGSIHYGEVEAASIGYTLKYMSKPSKIPMHKNDDRQPEFSLMSKGLGANYLTDDIKHWHLTDMVNRMYCTAPGDIKITMPRYYKNKLYNDGQRRAINEHQVPLIEERYQKKLAEHHTPGMYHRDLAELHLQQFEQQKKAAERRDKL